MYTHEHESWNLSFPFLGVCIYHGKQIIRIIIELKLGDQYQDYQVIGTQWCMEIGDLMYYVQAYSTGMYQ